MAPNTELCALYGHHKLADTKSTALRVLLSAGGFGLLEAQSAGRARHLAEAAAMNEQIRQLEAYRMQPVVESLQHSSSETDMINHSVPRGVFKGGEAFAEDVGRLLAKVAMEEELRKEARGISDVAGKALGALRNVAGAGGAGVEKALAGSAHNLGAARSAMSAVPVNVNAAKAAVPMAPSIRAAQSHAALGRLESQLGSAGGKLQPPPALPAQAVQAPLRPVVPKPPSSGRADVLPSGGDIANVGKQPAPAPVIPPAPTAPAGHLQAPAGGAPAGGAPAGEAGGAAPSGGEKPKGSLLGWKGKALGLAGLAGVGYAGYKTMQGVGNYMATPSYSTPAWGNTVPPRAGVSEYGY